MKHLSLYSVFAGRRAGGRGQHGGSAHNAALRAGLTAAHDARARGALAATPGARRARRAPARRTHRAPR